MTILLWWLSGSWNFFLLRLSLKISEDPTVQLFTLLLCQGSIVYFLLGRLRHLRQLEVVLQVFRNRNPIIFGLGLGFGGLCLTRCRRPHYRYWNFESKINRSISTLGYREGVALHVGVVFANRSFWNIFWTGTSLCSDTFLTWREIKLSAIVNPQLTLWLTLGRIGS